VRPDLLETLKIPGYRWLLLQNFGMSTGWTAEAIATAWLVLQLTDSPFWLGVVVGVRGLTQVVFSVLGGTIADRLELRRLIIRNQRVSVLLYIVVALLVITGYIQIWFVVVAQVIAGFLQAMNGPANQVLLYQTVGPSRLLSARALGFMVMSTTRILSALSGGFIIEQVGVGPAFLFVASGYLLGSLALIPLAPTITAPPGAAALDSMIAGLKYSMKTARVREILVLSLIAEAFGFSHQNMVPVMARDILQVGAVGLGYLAAASGVGQLVAMVVLANSGDVRRKDVLLLASTFGYGAAIFLFAFSPWFSVSILLSMAIGATGGVYDSTVSTVLQMIVRRDMRGRVIGLYSATWGSNQVGTFGLGALATVIGTPAAIASFAAVVCVSALRLFPKRMMLDPRHVSLDDPPEPSATTAPVDLPR
jgi:predicted MFS family arabinose efflux permease